MATVENIVHADDKTFDDVVIKSDKPALVDFWAPWCGPCHMLAPVFEELASEYKDRVRFVKVNVDEAQGTASSLGIMGIPTIALFHHGKPVDQQVGVQPKAILSNMLETVLRATSGSIPAGEQTK